MQKGFKTGVLKPFVDIFAIAKICGSPYKGLIAAAATATAAATGAATATAAATVWATETAVATATTRTATAAAASTTAVAATAAAAASTTAVAATAATATAKAAGTWGTSFHWTGFVHHNAAAAQRLTVHAGDCCLSFGIAAHLDKTKAFGAARVAFHHDLSAADSAELAKRLLQVFVADRVRQIADVKFVAHQGTPLKHII
jgi:hypothetical protein